MKVFHEALHQGYAQILSVEEVLHQSKTEFQDVLIFRNRVFGKVLVLDGVVQLTERDNHIYHEMMAHLPLFAHGRAKDVLVIGGGDGGVLKEVLKHDVARVVIAELDAELIDICRMHLPEVSAGAFEDPRVTRVHGDASDYVAGCKLKFDVILIDSTDPIGPGERLFDERFYARCASLLRNKGIVVAQSGAAFFQPDELHDVCDRLERAFGVAIPYLAPVPTYAGGMLALVAATSESERLRPGSKVLRERLDRSRVNTRYYAPKVHRAAFKFAPNFEPDETERVGEFRR